jgi:hypothetical protein
MKKIGIVLLLGMFCLGARSQVFHTVDSLRNYQNVYIRNSAINAFTNLRLNTVLNGIANFLDSARLAWGGGGGGGAADGNNYSNSLALSGGVLTLGRTGLSALTANIVTTHVTEGTNLYYTNARARSSLSAGMGITYNSGAGTITADTATLFGFLPYLSWDNKNLFDSTAWFKSSSEVRLKSVQHSSGNSALTITKTLTDSTRAYSFVVNYSTALWNASQIQGRDVSASAPSTNDVLKWSGSQWQPGTAGTGDVAGQSSSVDNEIALFSGTGGKTIKRATGTGVVHSTSGVFSVSNIALASEVTGQLPNANLVTFKTYPAETQVGTIYEKDNFTETDLAQDFQGVSGVVFSLNSGKIRCVSSTVSWSTYGRFLPYRPTLLPKWSFTEEYTIVSAFGSNVGHGPAIRSNNVNGANYGYMSYLSASSSTATPHLAKEDGTSDQTGTTFTITAGDKIRMVLSFADSVLTLTAQNLTTSSAVSTVTKTFNAASAPYVPNTGTLGFSNFSGTYDISYLKFSSTATKNPTLAVAADSKGQIFAGTFAGRFPNRLNTNYPTVLNYSGVGDQLKDFMDKKIEVMYLNAEQWWIILGSNDLRYGSSLTTTLNRLATIDSWFRGTQTRVYYSVIPEDSTAGHAGIGLTALKNYMASLYASQYIDLWTSFSTSNVLKTIYNSGDDIHPNSTAHTDIAAAGVSSGLLTVISPNRRTDFNSSGKNIALTGDQISIVPWGKNNVLRVDDSFRLAPSIIFCDVNKIIISTNQSTATAFNGALVTVEGTIAMTGNTSAMLWGDRTTPANYYGTLSNNNEFRWTYNGTEIGPYINSTGLFKVGNGGTPETIIGALDVNKGYTFVSGSQGALGLGLDVESVTYTSGAGAFSAVVGNSFGIPTIAGSGAVTFTNAYTVNIEGAPNAGTNATLVNSFAFRVQAGRSVFGGLMAYSTSLGPTADRDIPDVDYVKTGSLAFTNKTLTSSTNVLGGVTLTLGSDASYDMYYRSSGGVLTRLANGTTGQVLIATTSAAPSWGSNLTEGSYTPTLTGVANVAASTAYVTWYYRVGNRVHVFGQVSVDPTSASTLVQLGISLPVASTFSTSSELSGTAVSTGVAGLNGRIIADGGNNRAELQIFTSDAANQTYAFEFSYKL